VGPKEKDARRRARARDPKHSAGHAGGASRDPAKARAHRSGSALPVLPPPIRNAAAAIALIAVILRLGHIAQGLPDFGEEAIPFKRAFAMWGWDSGRADLNPHLFHYPSLSFYLHFLIQHLHLMVGLVAGRFHGASDYFLAYHTDPTPMVVVARLVGVIADAFIVVAVVAIGERARRGAGLIAAAVIALSPAMILDARAIFCDTPMAALAIWALERMLAWREAGGSRRLASAVILIGLAAGTKYPAALLVLPLAWVMWDREGTRGLTRWPLAVAGALLVFVITSPYALIDFTRFAADVSVVAGIAGRGHLGNPGRAGFGYYAGELLRNLGWIGVALLAVSLALTIMARGREKIAVGLWAFLLAFGIPISLGKVEAERYLIPVLPAAATLAGIAAITIAERAGGAARIASGVLAAILIVPVAIPGVKAAMSGADTTQLQARRWLEAHLGDHQMLVQEAYGASLLNELVKRELILSRAYTTASDEAQRRYQALKTYQAVTIPLATVGEAVVTLKLPGGETKRLRVFPDITDLNQIYYRPDLLGGADYILTSGAVRGRYEADTVRYAPENFFYHLLDRLAVRAASFRSHDGVSGPDIVVYALDQPLREKMFQNYGKLQLLWWTESIPREYRREADRVLRPEGPPNQGFPRDPDGRPAAWVQSLRTLHAERIRDFNYDLALSLSKVGRYREAQDLAASILDIDRDDVSASAIVARSAAMRGDWSAARAGIENLLRLRDPDARGLPDVRLEYARVLGQLGSLESARRQLAHIIEIAPGTPSAEKALQMLRELPQ
jgi:tetratricopeptide (TPR) repeat protein